MKITLMHYSIPPIVGGVESVLAHQARLMAADGHDVHIVAARGKSWTDAITFHRAPLVDSRHAEVLAVKKELDRGEKTARFDALREGAIEQIRPLLANSDVVIAHNICSLAKNLALTAALAELHQTPGFPRLILWHHDLAWTTPRYRSELYDGHPWNLLRSQWPGAVHVVVSQLRRRELAELIGIALDDIAVVPNGVDPVAFYKFDATTADLLAQIGIMNSAPILLLPVRLTRRKNIEFALHVLAALRRRMPAAALVVTGPLGAHNPTNIRYQEELTALRTKLLLQDSAIFLAEWSDAFLPDSVIADFYRLADALFMPSFEEGFGIPLIEAALSRTPIFCSEIEPLTELGCDDVTYFDPQGDPEGVAIQVATTLAQSRTYRFAVRARSAFTWEQVYTHHITPLLVGTSSKGRSE
ncbi:MAG: glycosyltransferase family 4 protein [Caldilinea sp.]